MRRSRLDPRIYEGAVTAMGGDWGSLRQTVIKRSIYGEYGLPPGLVSLIPPLVNEGGKGARHIDKRHSAAKLCAIAGSAINEAISVQAVWGYP